MLTDSVKYDTPISIVFDLTDKIEVATGMLTSIKVWYRIEDGQHCLFYSYKNLYRKYGSMVFYLFFYWNLYLFM